MLSSAVFPLSVLSVAALPFLIFGVSVADETRTFFDVDVHSQSLLVYDYRLSLLLLLYVQLLLLSLQLCGLGSQSGGVRSAVYAHAHARILVPVILGVISFFSRFR